MAEFTGSTGINRYTLGYSDGSEAEAVFLPMFAQYQEKVVAEIFTNLVEETPKQTGTMAFNWKIIRGQEPGSKYTENTGKMMNWEANMDREIMKVIGYKRPFQYYTIYNNSDYISLVDAGLGGNEHNQGFIDEALVKTKSKMG